MGYLIEDVKEALKVANLSYEIKEPNNKNKSEKKSRGRPKKIQKEDSDSEEKEEIEVTKIEIDNKIYFKTSENIILDIHTYEVIGILKNEKIEYIDSK